MQQQAGDSVTVLAYFKKTRKRNT